MSAAPKELAQQILDEMTQNGNYIPMSRSDLKRKSTDYPDAYQTPKRYFSQNLLDDISRRISHSIETYSTDQTFPESILILAIVDIFAKIGWPTYDAFRKSVKDITDDPANRFNYPFKEVVRNKDTQRLDFWIFRSYIEIGNDKFYISGKDRFPKKDVLLSRQFERFLNEYCEECFKGEVRFWTYHSDTDGRTYKYLIIPPKDKLGLKSSSTSDNLIMFQFKQN